MTSIEQNVLTNMRDLSLDKQQSILDFSLFLVNASPKKPALPMARDNASFALFLREFIKEIEDNPLVIETTLFDSDRPSDSGQTINLTSNGV